MPGVVRTYFVPQLVDSPALAGGIAIVIDQFRASTTICAALASGARAVVPCQTEEEALAVRAAAPESCLVGGEREGKLIPGFDLDNSPTVYAPEIVRGKTIGFTTTNGTKAVALALQAQTLLIGCLANASALAEFIGVDDRTVHIICAGTRMRVTLEDVIAAGAIAERLGAIGRPLQLPDARPDDDSTLIAVRLWREAEKDGLFETLNLSRGARNLTREGLGADIRACAAPDALPVVPVFDRAARAFVLRSSGR